LHKHSIEELAAKTSSLLPLNNIEIQHALRGDLNQPVIHTLRDEQFLRSGLQQPEHNSSINQQVDIVACKQCCPA
jgi:hypothetical protein